MREVWKFVEWFIDFHKPRNADSGVRLPTDVSAGIRNFGVSFTRATATKRSGLPPTLRNLAEQDKMSRPIEQALTNLIPRHSGSLPPELIELASSLLAQSRTKASNLKAEEEIGRTYACANIACERYLMFLFLWYFHLLPDFMLMVYRHRLKTTLNLPKIEPRPPIPPRLYSKLYGYFDRTLTASAARQRAKAGSARSTPSKALPERPTPRKEKSLEGFRANRTPKKGLKYVGNRERDERLPRWLAPTVRALCRGMDAGKAVPHVLAGVESVLCLPCPEEEDETDDGHEKMERKIPALVAAVWFFVMTRLAGEETNGKEYLKQRKIVLDILGGVKDDVVVVEKVGDGEEGWVGWEVVRDKDIDAWLRDLPKRGWLQMDWFQNIVEGSGANGRDVDDDIDMDELPSNPAKDGTKIMGAGLGTMRQDRFDYLSEAKRDEYAEWRAKILSKIDELIADGVMDDAMDTVEG